MVVWHKAESLVSESMASGSADLDHETSGKQPPFSEPFDDLKCGLTNSPTSWVVG